MSRIRFAVIGTSLLLAACPDEPSPKLPATDAGLTPISRPVTSTTTTTAAVLPPPVPDVAEPPPPTGACPSAPKWVARPPCVLDGFLYATGEFPSKAATHLARGTAANRARKRLALALGAHENDTFELKGSEIDQIYHCRGVTYALARVPHRDEGELRTCGPDQLTAAPAPKGCPEWTSRMAWREGDTLFGVAPAARMRQRTRSDQIAANRARQAVAEMVEVELRLSPEGVRSTTPPTPLREKDRSSTECGGARWVMVAFEKPRGS